MDSVRKKEMGELAAHVLVLALGAYLIWQRERVLAQMVALLAIALAACGAWGVVRWLRAKPRPDAVRLSGPVFALVSALVLYLMRAQVAGLVPMLIGMLSLGAGIVQGLVVLRCALDKLPAWWLHAPTALMWGIFGVLVLTGALNLNAIFALTGGIVLVIFGVLGAAESIASLWLRR